jgi:hypothetical protein
MRKTCCSSNDASIAAFSSRALARSWPNGFSISSRVGGSAPRPSPASHRPRAVSAK